MIKMIDIKMVSSHPLNPRKDLGDLTELAESIKHSGILQNLTIVPWFSKITGVGADDPTQQEKMGYYALIGNRRLAAAKLAGLTEVPCAIVDLNKKEQVATMLLENMQRSDLTVYEQAQGIQMMLDFGETINDISEKTGFSDSTVRRRMKLLELDQEKLKETAGRGATLADYAELEKIENIETRNKALEAIGTENFKWAIKNAIDEEENKKRFENNLNEIKKVATEVSDTKGLSYVESCHGGSSNFKIPKDADKVEYFYQMQGSWVYIYTKRQENEDIENEEEIKKQQLKEEKRSNLEKTSKRAYELRADFIKGISNATAKKNIGLIVESTIYTIIESYGYTSYESMAKLLGIESNDNDEFEFEDVIYGLRNKPEYYLLITIYSKLDNENEKYYDWQNKHKENKKLDRIYDLLKNLGYQISDEELALMNGTHELFGE